MEELHREYQNELFRLFRNYKKEGYDLVFPRSPITNDFTELLNTAGVISIHESCKWMNQNLSVRQLFTLPWTFTLEKLPECKRVTVVADYAPSQIEAGEFDVGKIVIDMKIEPYEVTEHKIIVEIL